MDTEELTVAVRVIQDSFATLSNDHVRMQEMSAYLEQRVRELERRIGGQPPQRDPAEGLPVSPAADVQKDGGEEASKIEFISEVEHRLGESLWEAPLIIGLPGLRPYNAGLLLLALLLNATVQTYLCIVLLTSGDFIQPDRFHDLEGPMRRWRMTHGHSLGQVDAAGATLVSRVCGDDASLAVAVSQGNLLSEINAYLGLRPEELRPRGLGTGPLLCTMCIFLFTGLVMKELRSLADSVLAVCAVSRGTTRLENGCLVEVARGRFAIFVVTAIVRAGIAVMLLCTGIYWLTATTSITDLILNAAALGFVMDFDEILFETVVPTTVHLFVQRLEPVKYKRPPGSLEAVVPLVVTIIVVGLSSILLIGRNVHQMEVVKEQLCGGSLDFATTRNPANYIVATPTVPFNEDLDPNIEQRAVQELIDQPQLGQGSVSFSLWSALPGFAARYSQITLPELAATMQCHDMDDEFTQLFKPYLFSAARYEAGADVGLSVIERPFRCADYATRCHNSGLLRMLCPITCGCVNPTSGLVEVGSAFGCPSSCEPLRHQRLRNASCVDASVANAQSWSSYWRRYASLFAEGGSYDDTERITLDAWTARKISGGCNNTEHDFKFGTDFCNYEDPFFSSQGLAHIIGFCPATCCRGLPSSADSACPSAC